MANRLGYSIVFTVLGVSALVAACGDDPATSDEGNGGAGGEPSSAAGSKSAGSSSGGNSGGKAGAASGGKAGSGQAGEGGEPAVGGASAGAGGASEAGAGGSEEGDGGAGGAGGLVYACNSTTISHKLCSALVAASCADPTICSDCVAERAGDREAFGACPACGAEYDAFLQCGIDAYEGGNLASGIECFEGFGADLNDACAPHLNEAIACLDYELENDCPATWPVE